MILDAISIVLTVFCLMGAGMLFTKMGLLDSNGSKLLAKITVNLGLVGLLVHNMFEKISRESLLSNGWAILVCVVSILITAALGLSTAKALRLPSNRAGGFATMFTFSNAIFIGLPIATALFGDEATLPAMLYFIVSNALFWSIGNALFARDGRTDAPKAAFSLKGLLPIPLLTFLVCLPFVLLGVKPPRFLLEASRYLGNLVTPVSLLYVGNIVMNMIDQGTLRWARGYLALMLGRFVLAPAVVLLLSFVCPMTPVMRNTLMVLAAMPVMTQCAIAAANNRADVEYAAGGLVFSTALTLVALPILRWAIELL